MTGFLYPFIDAEETDTVALLADLAASAEAKAATSARLRADTLVASAGELDAAATAMAERFDAGGRLFAFGNGGSSTDAANLVGLFAAPPRHDPLPRALPARSLTVDTAVLTALGNDVGFDLVFVRQLIAAAGPDDMAVGLSTSGGSENVLAAFAEASARGLLTVGMAGYDGGTMATSPHVDHCLVVRADSIHRIQETQAALAVALWERVQRRLAPTAVHA